MERPRTLWELKSTKSVKAKQYVLQLIEEGDTVSHEDVFQDSLDRMIDIAWHTCLSSKGEERASSTKIKNFGFLTKDTATTYVCDLLLKQEGRCALAGIPLASDNDTENPEFLCSLDRIDSNGRYEPRNLQVVCRFFNRWMGDDDNVEFQQLLDHLISYQ